MHTEIFKTGSISEQTTLEIAGHRLVRIKAR